MCVWELKYNDHKIDNSYNNDNNDNASSDGYNTSVHDGIDDK